MADDSTRDPRDANLPSWHRRRWSEKNFRQKLEVSLVFGVLGIMPAIFSLAIFWIPYELITGNQVWDLVRHPIGILVLCAWCGTMSVFMAKEDC